MIVRVRFFAHMAQHARNLAGPHADNSQIDVPDALPLADLPDLLQQRFPGLPWPTSTLLAVNQEYLPPTYLLRPGDEIAIIPPVSGG
ncbi:MAG TPA: MoaD/ThiS family protein [Phycisphaerae bacterium]|nr:MoaD/ThiS family protein [Phycisphaerae bacterium]